MIIKRHPEDFSVEEILTSEAGRRISARPGRHALYRLTKRGLGTDEAIEAAARALGVPDDAIGYVGLKDKHALTTQYVSVPWRAPAASPDGPPPSPRRGGSREKMASGMALLPSSVERARWSIERIGWIEERLRPEDVAGNKFRVVVRGLTRRQFTLIDEAAGFLAASPGTRRALSFVNYFGEQRFGSARHGRGFAARRLIEGDFEGALELVVAAAGRKDSREAKLVKRVLEASWGDWERVVEELPPGPTRTLTRRLAVSGAGYRAAFASLPQFIQRMTIESYQSWLWNRIALRVVRERCAPPFIEVRTRFGALLFPRAALVPKALASLAVPLLSPSTRLLEPWRSTAEIVLEEEGLGLDRLALPGLREPHFGSTPRTLFAEASELSLGPLERDESNVDERRFKRRLRFFLPRGAYGTVLLRALGSAPQSTLT